MKTLLYKPLFINPQAYYVFPNINGRLEPKTGSGKEPAIFVGNIEVRTIAYGDTSKKQYFYNTNEIDLSAFSGSLIRISLYTSRGNVVLGEWNLDVIEQEPGDYIDPEVLDSLCGVWIMDQNTNESESRNIIKNKIADRGGDLELLNFAYKANSGYNGYPEDFTSWNYNTGLIVSPTKVQNNGDAGRQLIYYHTSIRKEDVLEFKVKITLDEQSKIKYWYIKEDGTGTSITYSKSGTYTIPTSYFSKYTGENTWFGFEQLSGGCTIEQLPLYEGALVTDGKDDMIVSQKTVQEMLGGSNVCTVVSMIHTISSANNSYEAAYTNCIIDIDSPNNIIRNNVGAIGKTGIYGYKCSNLNTQTTNTSIINNILGDKNDYGISAMGAFSSTSKFSVIGFGNGAGLSEVAVYWTFISNKVLTTDEINQIIGYFKLDKYVTPQVIYDVKRQGLTNDTPAADWYLKDFSGNGHDMQLYNFAKKLGSGIGKYEADYSTWTKTAGIISTPFGFKITEPTHNYWLLYTSNITVPAHKVKISGIPEGGEFRYLGVHILKNGINELPKMEEHPSAIGFTLHRGTTQPSDWVGLSVEQIPDYEGALVSDGVTDYGQYIGDLGLKDYTIAVDRAYPSFKANGVPIISSIDTSAPFIFEFSTESDRISPFSYGASTVLMQNYPIDRKITYQSSYVYNSSSITKGSNKITGSGLTIGRYGVNAQYANIALWSLLLFPYSLSEFLLERQLKKYKLGTLHLDMVEFRPVVKSNVEYSVVCYLNYTHNLATIKSGDYVNIGDTIAARIVLNNTLDEVANAKVNGQECEVVNVFPRVFDCKFIITSKSPQKIDITIDEYIRYEDMDFTSAYPLIPIIDGYTYGDKLKVGTEVNYVKFSNLLPNVYSRRGEMQLNGVNIENNTLITVSKYMVFSINKTWLLDTTEPHAIYSPQKLNIPNSSLKILGYVPDLTGKGNHGKLNNFAYTEDSGVAADGSIKFDGTDDHITIPTLAHGGKCVMMKVNWSNNGMLYDQRLNSSVYTFGILTGKATLAYNARNNGSTYIDGILNANIIPSDLVGITHNITAVNDAAIDNNTVSPILGVSVSNATFSNQALYEFMLFPEIPSEDEIKKLNDVMGIEGGYVESPNYYWDAYGKKNTDTDRNLIADQVSKDVTNALEVKNVAYNSESGYNGYIELLFNKWSVFINENRAEIDKTDTTLNITKVYIQNKAIIYCGIGHYLADIPSKYKITGVDDTHPIKFGNDGFPNELILTVTKDGEYEVDWYNYGKNPCIMAGFIGDCNITIEQVAQYPNGLLLDGIEDHAVNTVIPAVTDFAAIIKRKYIGDTQPNNASILIKGDKINAEGIGNACLMEYAYNNKYNNYIFGQANSITLQSSDISYLTSNSYNGTVQTKGANNDTVGLSIGASDSFPKAVFYKLMLYTKTIDQLSINMLKNLFERDELIDVTNPIFKKQ